MLEKSLKFNHQETIIKIDNNILSNNWEFLDINKKYIIITEKNLANKYKNILNSIPNGIAILSLKPEKNINSLSSYEKIIKSFSSLNISKKDVIISFGGESLQNLATFVAATYLNGIELIQIPTTLFSQINSSIIGKKQISINNNNICGTTHLASKIIIDPSLLSTLPKQEILNGISEILKIGIIKDIDLINDLIENKLFDNQMHIIYIIDKCLEINYYLSTKKEFINNEENLLDFGNIYYNLIDKHTKNKLSHAEIRLLSMYFEVKESLRTNLLTIYESHFDLKKINLYIKELENIINSQKIESKIEIIKIGNSKLKR